MRCGRGCGGRRTGGRRCSEGGDGDEQAGGLTAEDAEGAEGAQRGGLRRDGCEQAEGLTAEDAEGAEDYIIEQVQRIIHRGTHRRGR